MNDLKQCQRGERKMKRKYRSKFVTKPPTRALVTGEKREIEQIKNTASIRRAKALLDLIPFSKTCEANPKGSFRESIKY